VVDTRGCLLGGYKVWFVEYSQQLLQLQVIVNGKTVHALILSPAAGMLMLSVVYYWLM
jgi:hypothetical protein